MDDSIAGKRHASIMHTLRLPSRIALFPAIEARGNIEKKVVEAGPNFALLVSSRGLSRLSFASNVAIALPFYWQKIDTSING